MPSPSTPRPSCRVERAQPATSTSTRAHKRHRPKAQSTHSSPLTLAGRGAPSASATAAPLFPSAAVSLPLCKHYAEHRRATPPRPSPSRNTARHRARRVVLPVRPGLDPDEHSTAGSDRTYSRRRPRPRCRNVVLTVLQLRTNTGMPTTTPNRVSSPPHQQRSRSLLVAKPLQRRTRDPSWHLGHRLGPDAVVTA